MKYSPETINYLQTRIYPILKTTTSIKFIKQYPKIIEELKSKVDNLETEQKLIFWLQNQKKKCTEKALQEIKSSNHIKQTTSTELVIKNKIKKSKPFVEINEKGEVNQVQVIKEEKSTNQIQYSKLEYIFKSDYAKEREVLIRETVQDTKKLIQSIKETSKKTLDKINKKIDEVDKDADLVAPILMETMLHEVSQLKEVLQTQREAESLTSEHFKKLATLKKSILDNYTAYSRIKTGGIYQIANLLYPTREMIFNELKAAEETLLKCDMAYLKLSEADASLVEKKIGEEIKDVNNIKDEELERVIEEARNKYNGMNIQDSTIKMD